MPDDAKQPLPYERPAAASPIPRWQFRLLFLLVLVNLAVTLQTAYVPSLRQDLKQWWDRRREARQVLAQYRQANTFTEPATKVVWEEDPEAAAKLLPAAGYTPVMVPDRLVNNYPFLAAWPPGAGAAAPAVFGPLLRHHPLAESGRILAAHEYGFAFLHGRTSPAGHERLVYVLVEGHLTNDTGPSRIPVPPGPWKAPAEPFEAASAKSLRLVAVPCSPPDGANPPRMLFEHATTLTIRPRGELQWTVPWRWVPPDAGKPGQVVLAGRDRFRFYAGQPDPADPSAFTMDYELNGTRGRLRARLRDNGRVHWEPDTGTVTGPYWNPFAR